MRGRWLTDRIEHLVGHVVSRMSADRREWGQAVVAEFAAIPPDERRLRWALGGLWFVLRRGTSMAALTPAVGWVSSVCAALGVISVLPWVLFSLQGLRETDAPDATLRSTVGMLVAQTVLIIAFVATFWPWRGARILLVAALLGYAVTAAFAAADNNGYPLLAAFVFAIPPGIAAAPIVLAKARSRHPRVFPY